MEKVRLDQLLLNRGFFESRTRAQWAIRHALVTVDGQKVLKPGEAVDQRSFVLIHDHPALNFISFGGYKLHTALEAFQVPVADTWAMDIGASTGGFTDCLLKHGALKVLALDVGEGQLHPSLRRNPKVEYYEGQDIRSFQHAYTANLITVDLSFISVTLIFKDILRFLDSEGKVIVLVKPQFEQDRKIHFKKGIIRNTDVVADAVNKVMEAAECEGLYARDIAIAPVEDDKNVEVFILFSMLRAGHRAHIMHRLYAMLGRAE